MLKDACKNEEIENIRDLTILFNKNPLLKTLLNQIDNILHLYYTLPITTSSAE